MIRLKTIPARALRSFAIALAAAACLAGPALAQGQERLQITIDQGHLNPLPIAVTNFAQDVKGAGQVGANLAQVITNNLQRSGLFRPIDPRAFIEQINDFNASPRFQDWRIIDVQALVTGETVQEADGKLRVKFRLYDTFREEELIGQQYKTTPENWRRVAHLISDEIYQRLTGESGYFDTRIVFISESGPKNRRTKRLAIMDQDGANPSFLTDGKDLVLTPRFSPSSQEITYMSYANDRPRVYILNLETGQRELVGDFPGMTFAPRFAPDGKSVALTLERGGNSDIFVMDLASRKSVRLTDHPGIDTSPSFAPDGQRIAFNSDRSGSQQLYVMNADGSGVERISFGDGKYATPVWSPRGDLIAFTKILRGQFSIGIMQPDGQGERILTDGFAVEGPTWAPNGRVLMFFSEQPTRPDGTGGEAAIYSIDLTGYNMRVVPTPSSASDPAWSPLIR